MSLPLPDPAPEQRFDWPVCSEAEQFVLGQLAQFTARHAFTAVLERRMADETGTLLLDWVDSLSLSAADEAAVRGAGFVPDPLATTPAGQRAFWHPEAMLPRLILIDAAGEYPNALCLRTESVVEFMLGELQGRLYEVNRIDVLEQVVARVDAYYQAVPAAEQQDVGCPLPAAVVAAMEWMRSWLAIPESNSAEMSGLFMSIRFYSIQGVNFKTHRPKEK